MIDFVHIAETLLMHSQGRLQQCLDDFQILTYQPVLFVEHKLVYKCINYFTYSY